MIKIYSAKEIINNKLFKSIGILTLGTVFAQIISFLFLPLISRVYSPSDFGVLAVFIAIVSIISVPACLRLDLAIPIENNDEKAFVLTILSLFFSFINSVFILVVIFFLPEKIYNILGIIDIYNVRYAIPFSIWLISSFIAMQFYNVRLNLFIRISYTKIFQVTLGAVFQLIIGIIYPHYIVLIIGYIITSSFGFIILFKSIKVKIDDFDLNLKIIKDIIIENKKYIKYSTLESLVNSASIQLPIIIISSMIGGYTIGLLLFATRIMSAPISLLGRSFNQVYLSRAKNLTSKGEISTQLEEFILYLIKIGLPFITILGLTVAYNCELIFGNKWSGLEPIIIIMLPMIILQFISNPVSSSLHILGEQKKAMYLQVFGFIFKMGSIYLCYKLNTDLVIDVYLLSSAFFYLIYILVILNAAGLSISSKLKIGKVLFSMAILCSIPFIIVR